MHERRQRAAPPVVAGLTVLALLLGTSGCEARSSIEAAQTAVALGQTALPGLQATTQVGATMLTGALGDSGAIALQLQALLAGASVSVATTPAGAGNTDAVTRVEITATDRRGSFGALDGGARQAAAGATLLLIGQYYPNATLALLVTSSTGATLASGTKAPGETPSVQTPSADSSVDHRV